MGVQGLWQLLEPLGRPVSLQSLDNKVLAIDASLWIHQAVRGFRSDAGGGPEANAHLLGAFHRVCKLLFYRIKPVFVFDGSVPTVKRETMAARREHRGDAARDAEKARREILSKQLKLRAIQAVASEQSTSAKSQPSTYISTTKHSDVDMFDLPPMPPSFNNVTNSSDDDEEEGLDGIGPFRDDEMGFGIHESYQNLEEIELDSCDFLALPLEIQHEILLQLKEKLKRKSWTSLTQMPHDAEEIGNHQIKQLLKRRKVQRKLDDIRKELNKSEMHDIEADETNRNVEMQRIASEDSAYFMLLKKPLGTTYTNSSASQHSEFKEEIDSRNPSDYKAYTKTAKKLTSDEPVTDSLPGSLLFHEDVADRLELSEESASDSEVVECDHREAQREKMKTSVSNSNLRECDCDVSIESESKKSERKSDTDSETQETSSKAPVFKSDTDFLVQKMKPESVSNTMMIGNISEPQPVSKISKIMIDVEDDDGDEDDFIEVESVQANSPKSPDELFPLECFQSREDVSTGVIEVDDRGSPLNLNLSAHEDVVALSERLEDEITDLAQAMGHQERIAATITDQMYAEIQDLLRLFGVPYVVSPAEAEAQCAVLDMLDLTQGTITDDSDVWLFGATRVYKNFFNQNRDLLFFKGADVQQRLGLDRRKLIALALLMGSDYTDGVKGIGRVTAVELLAEFSNGSVTGDDNDEDGDGIKCLHRFKAWWDKARKEKRMPKDETKIKRNLRSVKLQEGFPSPIVVKAYLEPTVDASTEPFSWARPDLDELRQFAYKKFGWNKEKTDGMLLPVIKQLNSQEHQLKLTAYFERTSTPEGCLATASQRSNSRQPSRRLRRAIKRVKNGGYMDGDDVPVRTARAETTQKVQGAEEITRRKNPRRTTTKADK